MTLNLAAAYAAIDSEREYQDKIIANDPTRHDQGNDRNHSVGSYCTMAQHYVNELAGAERADLLHLLRKIGAIAVHCMEEHGLSNRRPGPGLSIVPQPGRRQIYAAITLAILPPPGTVTDPADAEPETLPDVGGYAKQVAAEQRALVSAWTMQAGHDAALDAMLTLATTCVRCLGEYGAPLRVAPAAATP